MKDDDIRSCQAPRPSPLFSGSLPIVIIIHFCVIHEILNSQDIFWILEFTFFRNYLTYFDHFYQF